jgi:Trypsin-like peptidase domain
MDGPIYDHLAICVARIRVNEPVGTGFFVAPGQLLTCSHVIAAAEGHFDRVRVEYAGGIYKADLLERLEQPYPDLALLHVDIADHPIVYLDPVVSPGAKLYVYGFTPRYPAGESVLVEYEGQALLDPQSALMKFAGGQILPGLSGSPLLNLSSWTVAGIVKSTRDRASDLGGGGVATKTILERFPALVTLQQMLHKWDKRWLNAAQQQRIRESNADDKPSTAIVVRERAAAQRSSHQDVGPDRIPATTILRDLWCPQSLAWFAPEAIALGLK